MIVVAMIMVAIVVGVFGVLGPMGTYEALTAPQRFLYGALYACIGVPIGYCVTVVTAYRMRRRSAVEMALALAAASFFVSVPNTAVVHTIETLAHPEYSAAAGLPRLYTLVATTSVVYDLVFLYLVYLRVKHGNPVAVAAPASAPVQPTAEVTRADGFGDQQGESGRAPEDSDLVVTGAEKEPARGNESAIPHHVPDTPGKDATFPESGEGSVRSNENRGRVITGLPRSGARADQAEDQPDRERDDGDGHSRLWELLPEELGKDIIFLKSEDHYVNVRTATGSALVTMRFVDAVKELGDAGLQVHRSYWVSRRHIRGLTKRDRKLLLRLSRSHTVPISTPYRDAVQEILQSNVDS